MRTLIIISTLLIISSCSTTPYYSYTDPSFDPSQTVKRIMVQATNLDIQAKETMERYAQKSLIPYTESAVRHIDLFLPTREYTEVETQEIIKKNNIDAMLVVNLVNKGMTTDYDHHSSYHGYISYGSHWSSRRRHGTHIGIGFPFFPVGHHSVNQTATYEAVLFDAATGKKIWISSLSVETSSYQRLAAHAGKNIVDRLARDGIIRSNSTAGK